MNKKTISYIAASGATLQGECVELLPLLVAMQNPQGRFNVVLLMVGKSIAEFNSLEECVAFADACQMHPKLFYGTAKTSEMFRRAGSRGEFFAALNECANKARKS